MLSNKKEGDMVREAAQDQRKNKRCVQSLQHSGFAAATVVSLSNLCFVVHVEIPVIGTLGLPLPGASFVTAFSWFVTIPLTMVRFHP